MQLRDYQEQAVNALLVHLEYRQGNPCIVIPTGGGKSIVLAEYIRRCQQKWPGVRAIVLAHVKELVRQNTEKMRAVNPHADVGVYSAGLKSRDTGHDILFAGIQSVYKKSFSDIGGFDLVVIDEAHRIPTEGDGMYREFLRDQRRFQNLKGRRPRIVGLTATPFRMKSGMICGSENILSEVAYEAGITDLIEKGYLTQPVSQRTKHRVDLSGVRTQGGEFVGADLNELMGGEGLVEHHAAEIVNAGQGRKGWLCFCSGIQHAESMAHALETLGIPTGLVHSRISKSDRDSVIAAYCDKRLQAMVNVSVLTEGFDAPHTDLVALLRPTKSPGLYSQMCGRGLRISPGKQDCLILDFGQNISRHGAINQVRPVAQLGRQGRAPVKVCPECRFDSVPAASSVCPECDYKFPERTISLSANASEKQIFAKPAWYKVVTSKYREHFSKRSGVPSLRVDHLCDGGINCFSEWVCLEHGGYARLKAEQWWEKTCGTGGNAPHSIAEAIRSAQSGVLLSPKRILVDASGQFPNILKRDYGAPKDQYYGKAI